MIKEIWNSLITDQELIINVLKSSLHSLLFLIYCFHKVPLFYKRFLVWPYTGSYLFKRADANKGDHQKDAC